MTITTVMTTAGRTVTDVATLNANLIAGAVALSPGLTATLPGSLIEDISSTDTAALAVCDSAVSELVNSVTPYGANLFLLNQLGQIYLGAQNGSQGAPTNNSVYLVFTGTPGYVIVQGFTVSDGTYQYTVQDGGVVGAIGVTSPLYCLAVLAGTWAIPSGTVNQLVTSVPSTITLSASNPLAGTAGLGTETEEAYRARILQSGIVTSTGTPSLLKTLLANVSGVQVNLVSVVQQVSGGYEIIVGGGDPYEVAYAIFSSGVNITTLKGSTIDSSRNVTATINDYPDTYDVIFVVPPQQTVSVSVTWNTTSTNIIADAAIAQLASAPLVSYINGLYVGVPINLYELQDTFQTAVASAIPKQLLTRMVFQVIINGSLVVPSAGTGIIAGDPESYFYTSAAAISIARG
jgi:hypothetical protein